MNLAHELTLGDDPIRVHTCAQDIPQLRTDELSEIDVPDDVALWPNKICIGTHIIYVGSLKFRAALEQHCKLWQTNSAPDCPGHLGSGAFATVRIVRVGDTDVAVKTSVEPHTLDAEAEIMRRLDHPSIIKVVGGIPPAPVKSLMLECCLRDLRDHLEASLPRNLAWIRQLCQAVQYMHSQNIAHCDIKPENILIDAQGNAKLCDMGMALPADGKTWPRLGTLEYRAPEFLCGYEGDLKALDLWALGCVVFEILGPSRVSGDDDELYSVMRNIIRYVGRGEPPRDPQEAARGTPWHWPPQVADVRVTADEADDNLRKAVGPIWFGFVRELLQRDPSKRQIPGAL